MKQAQRYILLQLPGWVVAGGILWLLHRWLNLPLWIAGLLLAADVLKDFVLYPFLKHAYSNEGSATGEAALEGDVGEVRVALAPEGWIRIRGELWRARIRESETAEVGETVMVRGHNGRLLLVEKHTGGAR